MAKALRETDIFLRTYANSITTVKWARERVSTPLTPLSNPRIDGHAKGHQALTDQGSGYFSQ